MVLALHNLPFLLPVCVCVCLCCLLIDSTSDPRLLPFYAPASFQLIDSLLFQSLWWHMFLGCALLIVSFLCNSLSAFFIRLSLGTQEAHSPSLHKSSHQSPIHPVCYIRLSAGSVAKCHSVTVVGLMCTSTSLSHPSSSAHSSSLLPFTYWINAHLWLYLQ